MISLDETQVSKPRRTQGVEPTSVERSSLPSAEDLGKMREYLETVAAEGLERYILNMKLETSNTGLKRCLEFVLGRMQSAAYQATEAVKNASASPAAIPLEGTVRVMNKSGDPIDDPEASVATAVGVLTACRQLFSKVASFSIERQKLDSAGLYTVRFQLRPQNFAENAEKITPALLSSEQSVIANSLVEQVRTAGTWWQLTNKLDALSKEAHVVAFDKKTGVFWDPQATISQLNTVRALLANGQEQEAIAQVQSLPEAANIRGHVQEWMAAIVPEYRKVIAPESNTQTLIDALENLQPLLEVLTPLESGRDDSAKISEIVRALQFVQKNGLGEGNKNLKYVTSRLGIQAKVAQEYGAKKRK